MPIFRFDSKWPATANFATRAEDRLKPSTAILAAAFPMLKGDLMDLFQVADPDIFEFGPHRLSRM